MSSHRLELVDGTLKLLAAAESDVAALGGLLGASVADGWAGFPEAIPFIRASYEKEPEARKWGTLFFVERNAGALVGFGGFKGPPNDGPIWQWRHERG